MLKYSQRDGRGRVTLDGFARYQLTYRSLPYRVRTDRDLDQGGFARGELERFVFRKKGWAAKALQMPPPGGARSLKFTNAAPADIRGAEVPTPGTAIFPLQEMTYTWHDVPDVNETAHENCVGKVNSNTFDAHRASAPTPPARCCSRRRT